MGKEAELNLAQTRKELVEAQDLLGELQFLVVALVHQMGGAAVVRRDTILEIMGMDEEDRSTRHIPLPSGGLLLIQGESREPGEPEGGGDLDLGAPGEGGGDDEVGAGDPGDDEEPVSPGSGEVGGEPSEGHLA